MSLDRDPVYSEPLDLTNPASVYFNTTAWAFLTEALGEDLHRALQLAAEILPPDRAVKLVVRRIPLKHQEQYRREHLVDEARYFTLGDKIIFPVRVNTLSGQSRWYCPAARFLDDGDRAYLRALGRLGGSGVGR